MIKNIYTVFWKTTNNSKCYTVRSNDFPWMVPHRHLREIGFKFQIRITTVNFMGLSIRVIFLMTLGRGGGESTMGIRNFTLRRSQVRKRGKSGSFNFFPCLFTMQMVVLMLFVFFLPLFNSLTKKFFPRSKDYWRGFFSFASLNSPLWDKQMLVNKGI